MRYFILVQSSLPLVAYTCNAMCKIINMKESLFPVYSKLKYLLGVWYASHRIHYIYEIQTCANYSAHALSLCVTYII